MSKIVVETKGLTKSYDGVTVVDHLNLNIGEKEIFGLLGPNGAGKTTTILMLLGLTEPVSGSAQVFGHDPTREPMEVKKVIGYLPEVVGFYNHLTARQNLRFTAELNNISVDETEKRITELLDRVGISRAADLAVGKFSRGMRQRLGIADVLIKKPKIVFLDEPTSGLDPEGINQILDLMESLPQMGTTVVLSSHRLYEVQKICDRVGILSRGKLVAQGSVAELGKQAMAGARYQIEIETARTSPRALEIAGSIRGVIKAEAKGNTLLITSDSDLREQIAKVMAQNDLPPIQMRIHEVTLDDIYMKYFQQSETEEE